MVTYWWCASLLVFAADLPSSAAFYPSFVQTLTGHSLRPVQSPTASAGHAAKKARGAPRAQSRDHLDTPSALLLTSRRHYLEGVALVATSWLAHTQSGVAAGLSTDEIQKIIRQDFEDRQYYVTGQLTPSIYSPDCLFTDPTNRVKGVQRYTQALSVLFDPAHSKAELLSLTKRDDSHIFAEWRLQGYLKFPWHPYVKPYTGTTLYTIGPSGVITAHEETWSISAWDAALETLTPTAGPPKDA